MDKLKVIEALGALAQESRLDIFRLLVEKGQDGMMMSAIGEALDLPHATLSFHLDKLRQAGLVTNKREGRSVIYSANYDALVGSIRYLTENCCRDSDRSCRVEIKDKNPCCEEKS
jgi:DNA-binding transcriptional ArsR family regulator